MHAEIQSGLVITKTTRSLSFRVGLSSVLPISARPLLLQSVSMGLSSTEALDPTQE